jgi:hypothetical protein
MLISELKPLKAENNDGISEPHRLSDVYDPIRKERMAIYVRGDGYRVYFWPKTKSTWIFYKDIDLITLACLISSAIPADTLLEWKKITPDT